MRTPSWSNLIFTFLLVMVAVLNSVTVQADDHFGLFMKENANDILPEQFRGYYSYISDHKNFIERAIKEGLIDKGELREIIVEATYNHLRTTEENVDDLLFKAIFLRTVVILKLAMNGYMEHAYFEIDRLTTDVAWLSATVGTKFKKQKKDQKFDTILRNLITSAAQQIKYPTRVQMNRLNLTLESMMQKWEKEAKTNAASKEIRDESGFRHVQIYTSIFIVAVALIYFVPNADLFVNPYIVRSLTLINVAKYPLAAIGGFGNIGTFISKGSHDPAFYVSKEINRFESAAKICGELNRDLSNLVSSQGKTP